MIQSMLEDELRGVEHGPEEGFDDFAAAGGVFVQQGDGGGFSSSVGKRE